MVTLKYQERFRTIKGVFDELTNRNLFVLQSRGIFDELVQPLKVGKESNVFIAVKDGKKLIVKIYHLQNCNFNKMFGYIRKDARYLHLQKRRREIIFAWTQREFRNLKYAEKAGINAPRPIAFKDNILVEEFIGDEEAAPALKDVYSRDAGKFFDEVISDMKKLYRSGLIHGDLSSFNILNHRGKLYFIDFSQATLIKTPNSEELLERDVKNVCDFFKKRGVECGEGEVMEKIKA